MLHFVIEILYSSFGKYTNPRMAVIIMENANKTVKIVTHFN